jgi:hypothetical protein
VDAADLSADERGVLDRVNQKVAAADSLEALIDFVFEATRPLYPCDRLSVAFVEEDGRRVRSHYAVADYEPLVLGPGYAEDLSGSSLQAVIERGTPRILNDLEAYGRRHPGSRSTRLILREGIRSSMTSPLSVEGRHVGLLFRSSRRPGAYTERQARLHLALAERLGQAVEKTWRIRQLEEANRAVTEMLGFVSHELKSPVASLVTDGQLLSQGYLGPLRPKQREKLERMMAKGRHLLALVGEYLDLARVEGGELKLNRVLVDDFAAEVLEPAVQVTASQFEEREMTLTRDVPDTPVPITCDPTLVRIVLVNLLGNAAKYGRPGGTVRVRVKRTPDAALVSVWNEGPGFPERERSKLFRKFSRLDAPALRERPGTGVGLYTCWRIAQLHGGHITADSEEGAWAEFTLRLPQPE